MSNNNSNLPIASYGIDNKLIEQIICYATKHKIKKLILFGSRARGDYHRTSDIDLAVSGGDFNNFSLDVDELTATLLKYDFVNLDAPMQTELRTAIEQEGIVLYEEI